MKDHELLKLIQQFSYLGIFIWFALVQLIFPIPQEIALISIGYISTHIKINLLFSILASGIGILVSDLLIYILSRSGSKLTNMLLSKFDKSFLDKIKGEVNHKTYLTLFLLLLLPEVRMVAPLLGGAMNIATRKFIVVDLIANLLLSSVYLFLGKFFYSTMKSLGGKFKEYEHWIFGGIMLVILLGIVIFVRRKFFRK